MKKIFYHLLTICAVFAMTACSSVDDPENKKIQVESSNLTFAANDTYGEVDFSTTSHWSAYTGLGSGAPEEVEWLSLNSSNGSAGDNLLSFKLENNNTGSPRSAYIYILCEDEKATVKITQTTEKDEDDQPESSAGRFVEITCEIYNENNGQGYYHDGTISYTLEYILDKPVRMIANWRDDLDSQPGQGEHDSYCLNVQETIFNFTPESVHARIKDDVTYYPSGKHETENVSEHYADLKDGKATSGWYRWDDDGIMVDWDATYNTTGFLQETRNNDGASYMDTYKFTWTNDCITRIIWGSDKYVAIEYGDDKLVNLHPLFDINWVLPSELEIFDFSAGDITRIWASTGLMGNPSKLLMTSITEYDGYRTRKYLMNYRENTTGQTIVRVTYFIDGIEDSYRDWTIRYINF